MFKASQRHPVAPADSALARRLKAATSPFFGALEPVTVESPIEIVFEGSVGRDEIVAAWAWVVRGLGPSMAGEVPDGEADNEGLLDRVIEAMQEAEAAAVPDAEAERRLVGRLGGVKVRERLGTIMAGLRCRAALTKARHFGRATNAIDDEAALAGALKSIPTRDQRIAAFLFHAAMTEVSNPCRLVVAVTRLAGGTSDLAVARSGYGPLVDALLAHAQNQLPALRQTGPFADIDLICRSLERFHDLLRAVTGYIELTSRSEWTAITAALTRSVSHPVEVRLRDLLADLNRALRPRSGDDRLDSDRMLAALNGCYLLKTAHDCRDSLAVNAMLDRAWMQVGQALELHLERNLDELRKDPDDRIVAARVEAAIKMSELRFGTGYAEIMRRARDGAERRSA